MANLEDGHLSHPKIVRGLYFPYIEDGIFTLFKSSSGDFMIQTSSTRNSEIHIYGPLLAISVQNVFHP